MTHKPLSASEEKISEYRRDFSCKCGKTYMSYPAAYTHVKNKHNLDKEYVETIRRPKRDMLRKGRPKNRTYQHQSVKLIKLTLVERSILKMYSLLEGKFERIILQGNSQRNFHEFWDYFQALCEDKNELLVQFDLTGSEEIDLFIQLLSKDFTTDIAIRVRLVCLVIANMQSLNQVGYLQVLLNNMNLWLGDNKPNQIICETYQEWKRLNKLEETDQL